VIADFLPINFEFEFELVLNADKVILSYLLCFRVFKEIFNHIFV